jgi:major membrane immunogen (membrane-anchored lipoprotein)
VSARSPLRASALLAGAAVGAAIGQAVLTGCAVDAGPAASTLPDGDYTGTSATEDDGSYGVVTFSVSGGAVTDASFLVYDEDGTPHDEDYGLGSDGTPADQEFYQRAQNAIAAEKEFVSEFEETGDQNQVEAIAGASLSHRLFLDAVADAVADARQS